MILLLVRSQLESRAGQRIACPDAAQVCQVDWLIDI